jgi:HD-GYP domain-containing protein (c-di-GMP phosphodiesterase class II)
LTHYAEKALSSTMKDTRLSLPRRTEILHTTARTIMADVLTNPTAGDVVRRSARIANGTVDLFAQDPAALRTMAALFTRDYYTYTHCVHTCVLGVAMYKYLISPKMVELRRFGLGMLLHDVGKSLVDIQILNKPSRLSELEFIQMQAHPLMGWRALEQQGVNDGIIRQAVLMHHEKLDGSGYPSHIQAKDLDAPARLAAIVDVYDALTTDRQYRPAMSHRQAVDLMRNTMLGDHLDPEYFTALERVCMSFSNRPAPK